MAGEAANRSELKPKVGIFSTVLCYIQPFPTCKDCGSSYSPSTQAFFFLAWVQKFSACKAVGVGKTWSWFRGAQRKAVSLACIELWSVDPCADSGKMSPARYRE